MSFQKDCRHTNKSAQAKYWTVVNQRTTLQLKLCLVFKQLIHHRANQICPLVLTNNK